MQPNIPTAQDVQQSWDAFAEMYSNLLEPPNLQLGLSLARMLKVSSAKNILEVGCGSGRLAIDLLQVLPPGTKYTSLDISEEMIKIANQRKENSKQKLNPDIEHTFIKGDAEDLSMIPDESIDVYFAPLCFHLTPDPNKALREAMRVVKKGGRIGFSVLGSPEKCTFFRLFGDRVKEFKLEVANDRSIFYLGNRDASIQLAESNGIQVDFCWTEIVVQGMFDENDVLVISKAPSTAKKLNKLDEETRAKVIQAMQKDFTEKKKNFIPIQTENVLLIGRKPE